MTSKKTVIGTLYTSRLSLDTIKRDASPEEFAATGERKIDTGAEHMILHGYVEIEALKPLVGEGKDGSTRWVPFIVSETVLNDVDNPNAMVGWGGPFGGPSYRKDERRTGLVKGWAKFRKSEKSDALRKAILRLVRSIEGIEYEKEDKVRRAFEIVKTSKKAPAKLVEITKEEDVNEAAFGSSSAFDEIVLDL